jgi:hypothetical protein
MLIKIPGGVLYYSVLYCGGQDGITSQSATRIKGVHVQFPSP